MVEQLDLFEESEKQEQENGEDKLTDRQKALLKYIEENSFIHHRKTTQREICEYINGYVWNDNPKAHDHCTAIWHDINVIRLSYKSDYIIISDNYEYWIGNEEETKEFIDGLWSDLEPRLKRYWYFLKKIKRNGQAEMLDEKTNSLDAEIRRFIESYGKERISE